MDNRYRVNYTYWQQTPIIYGCFNDGTSYNIIMRQLDSTVRNLIDKVKSDNLVIPEFVLMVFTFSIINELMILEEAGLSHGDIKPENCFIGHSEYRAPVKLNTLK